MSIGFQMEGRNKWCYHVEDDGDNGSETLADCEDIEDSHEPEEKVHYVQKSGQIVRVFELEETHNERGPEQNNSKKVQPVPDTVEVLCHFLTQRATLCSNLETLDLMDLQFTVMKSI